MTLVQLYRRRRQFILWHYLAMMAFAVWPAVDSGVRWESAVWPVLLVTLSLWLGLTIYNHLIDNYRTHERVRL